MTRSLPSRLFTWANTLRLIGAGVFIYTAVSSGTEKPTVLLLCAAMMGVKLPVNADKKRNDE